MPIPLSSTANNQSLPVDFAETQILVRGAGNRLKLAIQELAGHADLTTTQRYMHLSPAEKDKSILLLDDRPVDGAGSAGREATGS